jgi:uncharacterized protein YbjQ (UPF0145 family)
MSLKLFTTHNYDETAYTPLGFVRGTMVHSISILRDFVGNVTSMFGGPNSAINKKIDDTYDEAIQELIKYTKTKYPTATGIAGINVSLTEMREFIICVACGTALAPKKSSSSSTEPFKQNTSIINPAPAPAPAPAPVPVGGFIKYSKRKTKKNTKRHSR